MAIKQQYGGNLFEKKRRDSKHAKAYELRIGKRAEVSRLLIDLLPYLICKKAQAELALAFLALGTIKKEICGRVSNRNGGTTARLVAPEGSQERREAMKQRLQLLNRRGA